MSNRRCLMQPWSVWKTCEVVEAGDTLQTCWTDTRILYRVVRVGADLYYVEHTPNEHDDYVLQGSVVTRSTGPVWRYDDGDVALLAQEPPIVVPATDTPGLGEG